MTFHLFQSEHQIQFPHVILEINLSVFAFQGCESKCVLIIFRFGAIYSLMDTMC